MLGKYYQTSFLFNMKNTRFLCNCHIYTNLCLKTLYFTQILSGDIESHSSFCEIVIKKLVKNTGKNAY